jgi:IS5 family transposase
MQMEFRQDYSIPVEDVKDLVTAIFVLTDDLYNEYAPDEIKNRLHKDKAKMSDSEIITIAIMGEIMTIDSENAWVRYVRKNMRDLFPRMCERSRFNRLRRNLSSVSEYIRVKLGAKLDFTDDEYRIVDSFPVQICEFGRAKFCRTFKGEGADYGHCPSKKKTYFGYKLHALCTVNGYITDFFLTPASVDDRVAVRDLVEEYERYLKLIGDKGYTGVDFAQNLWEQKGILMISLKKNNAKNPDPKPIRQTVFKVRRRIETSFSQLSDQFNAEYVRAKSLWGLFTRLQSKILAFNLCFAINWLSGRSDRIACFKSLVF